MGVAERFWSKVNKDGPKQEHMATCCWVWTAGATKAGYGALGVGKNVVRYAHHISYELHFGEILNGKWVLHRCDERRCVRPDHLYAGTQQENLADMKSRGRGRGGGAKGERCCFAKLTASKVKFIRESSLSGPALAKRFGVTHQAIYAIRSRKTWRHV